MPRIKPTVNRINSLDEADAALKQIALATIKLESIDGKHERKIAEIREKAANEGAELRKQIESLGAALSLYAQYNKADLFDKGDRKTIELNWGQLGYRLSTKLHVKRVAKTIELLKTLFDGKGVRVKEEVDKEELREWPDSDLIKVGVSRAEEDAFWFETNKERVNEEILKTQSA